MSNWADTEEAEAFVATAASRQTSPKIMQAIAFFANNAVEAEALWTGEGFGEICTPVDFWEHVTGNGRHEAENYAWGEMGARWWSTLADAS